MPGESEQAFFDSLRPPIEAVRLAEFAEKIQGEDWLEIGCGNGFIALWLAACHPSLKRISGIDLNSGRVVQAKDNKVSFQQLTGKNLSAEFFFQDARTFHTEHTFDGIICNPPFFAARASRPSPHTERRAARQDATLSLTELFGIAKCLLKPEGILALVFPGFRYEELRAVAVRYGFTVENQQHLPEVRKRNGGVWLTAFRQNV